MRIKKKMNNINIVNKKYKKYISKELKQLEIKDRDWKVMMLKILFLIKYIITIFLFSKEIDNLYIH